jgi:hypothetical protein
MRWSLAIGAFASGCYAPSAPSNVPCGDGDACPTGQTCIADRCTAGPVLEVDADTPPDLDAAVDAPIAATVSFGDRDGAIPNTLFDTFLDINGDEPNNFGAHPDLHLRSAFEAPILIRVDVSAIPDVATVAGARLRLEVTFDEIPAGRAVRVFEMNESWIEGTGNNSAGAANHTHRNPDDEWATHGAAPPSRDSNAIASQTIATTIDEGGELVIELPPQLVAGWIANPATNLGIALLVSGDNFYCELASTEGSQAGRPILEVDLSATRP